MKIVTKRIFAFLVMALVAFTTYFPVNAAKSRVDGYDGGSLYDYFSLGQSQSPDDLTVEPGDEIRIPLTADLFTYTDGKVPIFMEAMSYNQLAKVRVRTRVRAGSETLDYVQFDRDTFDGKPFIRPGGTTFTGTTAYISVMFAKKFISVEDKDFDFTIYLSIDGKPYDDELSINLSGTLEVETEEVDKSTDYVDLSEGVVAEATETVMGVCADLGAGVQVYTDMFKGNKYCGQAKVMEGVDAYVDELDKIKTEDLDLPELYPDIAAIYKLQSIGLKRSSSEVKFDVSEGFSGNCVYDENFKYLGMMGDSFPYSDYYFVTNGRLPQFDALPLNQ